MRLTGLKYFLLFLAQAVLWNYFNFSQYIVIAILPAMILCLPISRSTVEAMLIAFVTGVAMDFLVTGQLGLTAFALVPAGLLRRQVISLVFGSELFARGEELSLHRQGWLKFALAILLLTAVFLLPYIWLDDADESELIFTLEDGVLSASYFYYDADTREACDVAFALTREA